MSIKKGSLYIAGVGSDSGYHPDLFDHKWADHILNDVQWLRADTFSWQSGAVYQAAYQHLADDIDGKTLQSETIDETTIQFYLADDGHKICPASEESNVTAIYNATGVAWYYIIDTANTRFKLPRTQFAFTGIRNGVGGFVEAGLPNITGTFNPSSRGSFQTSGAISDTGTQATWYFEGGDWHSNTNSRILDFDASRSSSVYGNSDTVQPKATEMYLYFYVGQYTQSAIEQTAGLNAELFNGKADLDLSNVLANIDFVVERQEPTAENNYTWYRKYRSGWVEQGGSQKFTAAQTVYTTVNLPVEMANSNYTLVSQPGYTIRTGTNTGQHVASRNGLKTTTTIFIAAYGAGSSDLTDYIDWQVSGMAAN